MAELWDVYDGNRRKTGLFHERGKGKMEQGEYHLVVQVWIVNRNGQYLMSKRHPDKPYALKWESTGGSVLSGESSLEGAVREVREELGIRLDSSKGRLIKSVRNDAMHEFYDVWLFQRDVEIKDLNLQSEEVVDVRWMSPLEISALHNKGELHPKLDYYAEVFEVSGDLNL